MIDKISYLNPKAGILRETLANRPVAKGFPLDNWDEENVPEEPVTGELTLSNK